VRVLLLADVHANWDALLALQRAERQPDAVLFAGDAVGYGPDPAECARWLLAHARLAVQGNHDAAARRGAPGPVPGAPAELAEAAQAALDFARRRLSPADLSGLAAWPQAGSISLGGAGFYLVHGTPADPLSGWLEAATAAEAELERLFAEVPGDVIVHGHTHLPALRRLGRRLIVNPGSLGQPRYGVPDATYAVWDDGRVQIHHLHYHPEPVARRLALAGLDPDAVDQLAEVLTTGML
jgi:putative phosphoesterase